jgi:phage-related minor tail protein
MNQHQRRNEIGEGGNQQWHESGIIGVAMAKKWRIVSKRKRRAARRKIGAAAARNGSIIQQKAAARRACACVTLIASHRGIRLIMAKMASSKQYQSLSAVAGVAYHVA